MSTKADHPAADRETGAESRPLFSNNSDETSRRSSPSTFTTFPSLASKESEDSEKSAYAPAPTSIAPEAGHGFPLAHANHAVHNSEFVRWEDFWDTKKGWMKFWDPAMTWSQITTRDRDDSLFCFDAFRCFAFLWVSNSHVQEGMSILYDSAFNTWINTLNPCIAQTSFTGVVVFFVVSGFLNLMVSMSIARKLKDKVFSFKSARTFIFRRYMHLAPNLYIAIIVALAVGCLSGLATLNSSFCTPCKSLWWTDYLLVGNFGNMWFGDSCFNSTWTVSAQMQLYLAALSIKATYYSSPIAAFVLCIIVVILTVLLRLKLIIEYADGQTTYSGYVYEPFYSRADSYCMGMMLWMIYEQVLKPIKYRLYVPKHLRNLPDRNKSASSANSAGAGHNSAQADGGPSEQDSLLPTAAPSAATTASSEDEDWQQKTWTFVKQASQTLIVQPAEQVYRDSVVPFVEMRLEGIAMFHQYASWQLITSMYLLLPFMAYFTFLGIQYACVNPSTYWWTTWITSYVDQSQSLYVTMSYALFAVAAGTMGLLFFALEGTLFVWPYLCSFWVWYPIGMLSYTAYLLSIITSYWIFSVLLLYNDNRAKAWDAVENPWLVYVGYYWFVIAVNIACAMVMSFLVERPLMNLSKAIDV